MFVLAEEVLIEFGDFSMEDSKKEYFKITEIYSAPGYEFGYRIKNDVSLLKVERSFREDYAINLCHYEETCHPVLLGAVGMGATKSGSGLKMLASIPDKLQEVVFHQTIFDDEWNPFDIDMCPGYNVCVEPMIRDGNICTFDYGGPLYKYRLGTFLPKCLYGVASYAMQRPDRGNEQCNGGSRFANVPYFHEWITNVMKYG
ncbi:uncharacterized protein LOC142335561 [Convolutriloba macropyga]|uniref:uncharacterized protein LOC142335561 n=1 Tax=Convolutriloba macropyga TaxID=536237 RepID=UPI003F51DA72